MQAAVSVRQPSSRPIVAAAALLSALALGTAGGYSLRALTSAEVAVGSAASQISSQVQPEQSQSMIRHVQPFTLRGLAAKNSEGDGIEDSALFSDSGQAEKVISRQGAQ